MPIANVVFNMIEERVQNLEQKEIENAKFQGNMDAKFESIIEKVDDLKDVIKIGFSQIHQKMDDLQQENNENQRSIDKINQESLDRKALISRVLKVVGIFSLPIIGACCSKFGDNIYEFFVK